jgi:ParB family chromosome partitioning protein
MNAKKPQISGLGLESTGSFSDLLSEPDATVSFGPLELALDLIDEDPKQPRTKDNPGFSRRSLEELAATIRLRGVKTPISVRENLGAEGRYIINHGARRYRASRIAGKTAIPAFVDNDYSEADQVIENLQRNELTAREIADFIGRELSLGKKKSQIAREIGKSPAFVTQYVTLLDLPDPIAVAFNTGRTNDVTVVNELVAAYKKDPADVDVWLADDSQELTRGSVRLLREFLDDKRKHRVEDEHASYTVNTFTDTEDHEGKRETEADAKRKESAPNPEKLKKAIVRVKHGGRLARLVLHRRPAKEGSAWLRYEDNGYEFEAELGDVQLVAILEG